MNTVIQTSGWPTTASLLRVATIAAALYLVLLPFHHMAALKNLCLAVIFFCALPIWLRGKARHIPLLSAFIVWLVAASASLLWSRDVHESLEAIWRDVGKTGLVFFSYYAIARHGSSLSLILRIALVGASFFALLAIHDFTVHGWWDNTYTPARYDVSVDVLNWMVFIGMFSAAMLTVSTTRWLPWLGFMTVTLLAITGVMTQSRSFNLAIVLSVGLIVALNIRSICHNKLRGGLVALAVFVIVFLAITLLDRSLTDYIDRWQLYSVVWEKITSNFWLGSGFGHETDKSWYHATFDNGRVPGAPSGFTHPHNIVLSYMDQMGIWGLLVLLYLFGSITKPLWMALRSGNPWHVWLAQTGLVLILVTLLFNAFNFYFSRQHLWMFFAMLGLLYGWLKVEDEPAGFAADSLGETHGAASPGQDRLGDKA